MGTKIEMVSVSRPAFGMIHGNSINLTVKAAKQCIDEAGIDPSDIGVLINTGIYRSKNLGEPAIAALIQKKIGANLTHENDHKYPHGTFSFDLNNGGCGWLNGIQIIHDKINNGEISHGMVVTGDSEPFYRLSRGYQYKSAGAAILLANSTGSTGFTLFRSYTFSDHCEELTSHTEFRRLKGKWRKKNILYVSEKETYVDLCIDCAIESLNSFLNESGIKLSEIDLIIPSQSPAGFLSKMKSRTGLNNHFIEIAGTGNKELHTAGPAFALKKAYIDNRFNSSKNIIFLTVGSGINVTVALYNNIN